MKLFNLVRVFLVFFSLVVCAATPLAYSAQETSKTTVQKTVVQTDKVSINRASAEELAEKLVGVGKSKAQAIVEFRKTNGEFRHIDELTEVKGIGQAILDKNKERLAL